MLENLICGMPAMGGSAAAIAGTGIAGEEGVVLLSRCAPIYPNSLDDISMAAGFPFRNVPPPRLGFNVRTSGSDGSARNGFRNSLRRGPPQQQQQILNTPMVASQSIGPPVRFESDYDFETANQKFQEIARCDDDTTLPGEGDADAGKDSEKQKPAGSAEDSKPKSSAEKQQTTAIHPQQDEVKKSQGTSASADDSKKKEEAGKAKHEKGAGPDGSKKPTESKQDGGEWNGHAGEEGSNSGRGVHIGYDKQASFFDNLSSETRPKGARNIDWKKERLTNEETFGSAAVRLLDQRNRGFASSGSSVLTPRGGGGAGAGLNFIPNFMASHGRVNPQAMFYEQQPRIVYVPVIYDSGQLVAMGGSGGVGAGSHRVTHLRSRSFGGGKDSAIQARGTGGSGRNTTASGGRDRRTKRQ